MRWRRLLPECLIVSVVIALESSPVWSANVSRPAAPWRPSAWTSERKLNAREQTRDLWYHGFDNYMAHAFPFDELAPLSCVGQGPDWANPANIGANDVMGNFSLTLVDVLDTFVVLGDRPGFEKAVRDVIDHVSFNVNTKPQVFETTIRVLGGLLSGHIFASQEGHPFHLPWYKGELLHLAQDLGERLLPAFKTPTGLPYARVNLRHGIQRGESLDTCSAGAGSLILEFATLSRLTGDERFEKAARKAFFAVWNRKSDIGLIGNTINTFTGDWTYPQTSSIGAGIDSFFEYALKWYIMSGDVEFLDVWDDAYAAIMRYSRSTDGTWYRTVNMNSGDAVYNTIDSLSAFWPGLATLAGDIQNAIKLHLMYWNLWRRHSGLPEVYDTSFKIATSHQYPLRPEFVESTWYLYRATKDPFYLDVAERILFDLITRTKVPCGLCGIEDLRVNKRDDRMESFVLSETLKYLFLVFDEANPLHSDDSSYVFTTEGHILYLPPDTIKPMSSARKQFRKIENHQCPAYQPVLQATQPDGTGLRSSITSRADFEYARELVGVPASDSDAISWSPDGVCERPKVELFTYDYILSSAGEGVKEDLSPSLLKVAPSEDGYVIHNVTGVRVHIVQRLDGEGYDIKKVGQYHVRGGQLVYINDTNLVGLLKDENPRLRDGTDVPLHFYSDEIQQSLDGDDSSAPELLATSYSSLFGGSAFSDTLRFGDGDVALARNKLNALGCNRYTDSYAGSVLLVKRGGCTFVQKLVNAKEAGAVGAIVLSDEESGINPTSDKDELAKAGDISDVVMVLLAKDAVVILEEMMDLVENRDSGVLRFAVVDEDDSDASIPDEILNNNPAEKDRILYLNGIALTNTRLLI